MSSGIDGSGSGGGLMQLLAYGNEDLYLTGNPNMTYFKLVYRRHTNFSMESVRQEFATEFKLSPTQTTTVRAHVDRTADLCSNMYLVFKIPDIFSTQGQFFKWVRNLGHNIIERVMITIDGRQIDTHYSQWLNIWTELAYSDEKRRCYDKMTGNIPENFDEDVINYDDSVWPGNTRVSPKVPAIKGDLLYIPLYFWFNMEPGLALPLIALQYENVFLEFDFRPLNDIFTIGEPGINIKTLRNLAPGAQIDLTVSDFIDNRLGEINTFETFTDDFIEDAWVEINYIFLDTEERQRFAKVEHEYLIHQVQRKFELGLPGGPSIIELFFTHPVKELIFVTQRNDAHLRNEWNNYTNFAHEDVEEPDKEKIILKNAVLRVNGFDRFRVKDYKYFNSVQPWQHHTACPKDGIHVYSFAINPEEFQPSGTMNLSQTNRIELAVDLIDPPRDPDTGEFLYTFDVNIFALSYNVFRLIGGMGEVVFAT